MKYYGNNVSSGIAIGEAYLYIPFVPRINETVISENQVNEEVRCLKDAREKAKGSILSVIDKLSVEKDEKAKIFAAHLDILFDAVLEEEILCYIKDKKFNAEFAVNSIYDKYAKMLDNSKDEILRERSADIRDVKTRLLRILSDMPEQNLGILEKPVVVFANNLLPSDTATLDRKNVLAIVTETGGETSHTAIIAKSLEIPAILGVKDIISHVKQNDVVIVDAVNGNLYIDPDEEQLKFFLKKRAEYLENVKNIRDFIGIEPFMQDGRRIEIHLNIGSGNPHELACSSLVDGIGLFRTEFLYMEKNYPPTEEEQFQVYRKVLSHFGNKPVILRTLDIGGDKAIDYLNLPKEDNPFLGNRALRLCLSRPDLFKTQLRAAFRASVFGNLLIMLPMVGSLEEIRKAKGIIEEVKVELKSAMIQYKEDVKIGIMIEIPSIALIADIVAKEVDFASIGTNDLCQYCMAVDRMNPSISEYYQSYHPAVFRLIGFVSEEFGKQGKPLSVCGELGGDPLAPAVLIGLGITKLSMGLSSVARTKKLINGLTMKKAVEIAATVQTLSTAADVCMYLKSELKEILD